MTTSQQTRMRPIDLVSSLLRDTDEIVAVTGATGWFGAVALDLLFEAFGDKAAAQVAGYASSAGKVPLSDGRTLKVRPLVDLLSQDPPPTTLLHFAFLTREKIAALGVEKYTSQNVAITATVLGAITRHKPRRVVFASSGAVYSPMGQLVSDLHDDPYGTLKHVDEVVFRAATHAVGGVCVIPRVFSVAGARMTKPALYALGSMIGMAAGGGPIKVHARGPVFRSYSGVDEVVALALWAALSGRDAIFDTCGTVIEVGDLANLVAHVHGPDCQVVRQIFDPDAAADRYVGDGRLMEELATEARLSLRSLPALVHETSGWLTTTG